ncbi:Octicosapeptide/phox/Bem1p family protein [Thalictrum thalictroides]|uniref:Octicosapeptide/phox/Bem1p family protein n=1 Tax=Thalictrum thalictroides TaxID=46969 RepID=A0A7J6WQ91_THATH|nr:Octicosapeptide/phox/Bem1p family protein [Thalictrum thalictroides]
MTSLHPSEFDCRDTDSVASSPRSDYPLNDAQPRVRFMCSFGGQILPRPHDSQLRYVGGDTRIVAIQRSTTFSSLLAKLAKLSGNANFTVKYQLPNEDLDALISVTTDEDVDNMMEEYDRLAVSGNTKVARLRLFLFPVGISRATSSISSLLDSSRREYWFFDALNGGSASGAPSIERGRSDISSIVSEVPDYLFGLDSVDENREPKHKSRLAENVSVSDPGSPAPVVNPSPYCSTTSIPDLPPVKTRIESASPRHAMNQKPNQGESLVETTGEQFMTQQTAYQGNTMWQYAPEPQYPNSPSLQPMPVYYVPGPVPGSTVPVQVQRVTAQAPYIHRFPVPVSQLPVNYPQQIPGMGQVYGAGMRPVHAMEGYDYPVVVQDGGVSQAMYYGGRNAGLVPAGYQNQTTMVPLPLGTELQGGTGTDMKINTVTQQPHS